MNKAPWLDMGEKPQSHPETAVKNAGTCGKTTPLNEGGSWIDRKKPAYKPENTHMAVVFSHDAQIEYI